MGLDLGSETTQWDGSRQPITLQVPHLCSSAWSGCRVAGARLAVSWLPHAWENSGAQGERQGQTGTRRDTRGKAQPNKEEAGIVRWDSEMSHVLANGSNAMVK